jgi:uncharacterized linocin/CFP29 family protein
MNNLHRELAPISSAAWTDIETEARRTFEQNVAARRVVDLAGPDGPGLASVNTGHLSDVDAPADGVLAKLRASQPLVQLRVPFTVNRQDVDDVERGAQDPDWQPVKDAAKKIAFAEDRAISRGVRGRPGSPGSGRARPTRRSRCPLRSATTRTRSARR